MSGRPQEQVKKAGYSVTLNPITVEKLRAKSKDFNLSAFCNEALWAEVQMQENQGRRRKCLCGLIAYLVAWRKWGYVCQNCGQDWSGKLSELQVVSDGE